MFSTIRQWLKKMWAEYNQLCDDLGVDQGACRSCVPVVKFDEDKDQQEQNPQHSEHQSF